MISSVPVLSNILLAGVRKRCQSLRNFLFPKFLLN
jgi:hypothetical protein